MNFCSDPNGSPISGLAVSLCSEDVLCLKRVLPKHWGHSTPVVFTGFTTFFAGLAMCPYIFTLIGVNCFLKQSGFFVEKFGVPHICMAKLRVAGCCAL